MQGVERVDRELLDAEALVGHLVAEGSMFAFLAAHRQDVFPDNAFEDLFPSGKGRPSIPVSVMAAILVLQTLHDLSDRETAEAARCGNTSTRRPQDWLPTKRRAFRCDVCAGGAAVAVL